MRLEQALLPSFLFSKNSICPDRGRSRNILLAPPRAHRGIRTPRRQSLPFSTIRERPHPRYADRHRLAFMIRRRPWRARHRSTRQTGGSPRRALGSAPSKLRECPPPNLRDPHARDFHRASGAYRVVTHYYSHLSVATLRLDSGTLRVGDVIHIRGMRSRAFRLITAETPVGLFARRKTYDRMARCVLMVRKNRHTPHPLVARSRAAIAITAPDICSRSA